MQPETVWFIGALNEALDVFADELVELLKDELCLLQICVVTRLLAAGGDAPCIPPR